MTVEELYEKYAAAYSGDYQPPESSESEDQEEEEEQAEGLIEADEEGEVTTDGDASTEGYSG